MKELTEIEIFLTDMHGLHIELAERLEELEREENDPAVDVKAINYDIPHVTGGKISDLSDAIIQKDRKIERLKQECQASIDRLKDKRIILDQLLKLLIGSDVRGIILARYMNNKEWTVIANQYHYSERHVKRIHNQAIKDWNQNHSKEVHQIISKSCHTMS